MLPNTQKQLIVLDGHRLDEERGRRGMNIEFVALIAGVSYKSAWRVLASMPVGQDIAERVADVLGFTVDQVKVAPDACRPANGCSPEAVEYFNRKFKLKVKQLICECHRETGAEARRRCWFWPSFKAVSHRLRVPTLRMGAE